MRLEEKKRNKFIFPLPKYSPTGPARWVKYYLEVLAGRRARATATVPASGHLGQGTKRPRTTGGGE